MKKFLALFLTVVLLMSFAGCSMITSMFEDLTYEHEVMMVWQKVSTKRTSPESHNWRSSVWTIYFDGTVEYYETFDGRNGKVNPDEWSVTLSDVDELYDIALMKKGKEDNNLTTDDAKWNIKFYSQKGELIGEFDGGISGDRSLKKAYDIIKK
jgi:hypothetical protein